jgi:hypothetical protein
MLPVKEHPRPGTVATVLLGVTCAVIAASLLVPCAAAALPGLMPEEISELDMGVPSSAVIEKIKSKGSYTIEPLPLDGRTRVVWVVPNDPHYKNVIFYFTEKDRLCIIRFTLDDISRGESPALKKAFFDKFDFSWDRPSKLRIKDEDAILYGAEKNNRLFFLEFTDRKTRERAFELFDRRVSSEDRTVKKAQKPKESGENGTAADPKATTGDQSDPGSAPSAQQGPLEQPQAVTGPPVAPEQPQAGTEPKVAAETQPDAKSDTPQQPPSPAATNVPKEGK